MTLYKASADLGNDLAQCSIGDMYRKGEGVPQSDQEAEKWYRTSAEKGCKEAINELVKMGKDVSGYNAED